MSSILENIATALTAVADVPVEASIFPRLSDDDLVLVQAKLAELRRLVDARSAAAAAHIAHRSRRELGYGGLAQRRGHRTADALIQSVTRSTRQDARALMRVGAVLRESQVEADSPQLWFGNIGEAVARGDLSLAAADAIRTGLGVPGDRVGTESLREATRVLVTSAQTLDADVLFTKARALRDQLDAAGIADREAERRARRYLRLAPLADGMVRLTGLLDPESAALVTDAVDLVTSPRRGGPRFVARAEKSRAEELLADERTTDQITLDALVGMVKIAGDADAGTVFGNRRPGVRVLVSARALERPSGHGRIEGRSDPVSIETVERYACDAGIVPIAFDDDGACLNVGREQRLFTARQRIALGARDGGCLWADCRRPPSWCEAHHIDHWHRDHGETNVADGVLLCRHHHMLLHDNHWQIVRRGAEYLLVPPDSIDASRTPIPLPSKSSALGDLLVEQRVG
jgi:hypothetical protein